MSRQTHLIVRGVETVVDVCGLPYSRRGRDNYECDRPPGHDGKCGRGRCMHCGVLCDDVSEPLPDYSYPLCSDCVAAYSRCDLCRFPAPHHWNGCPESTCSDEDKRKARGT